LRGLGERYSVVILMVAKGERDGDEASLNWIGVSMGALRARH
jgi:hypothetical protein